jgi:DNA replication protein DnaC
LQRRYQISGLDERLTLTDFDWSYNPEVPKRACFELHALKFITEGDNAIFCGQAGTGKSHIAKTIAYAAVRAGLRVHYAEADELLGQLSLDTLLQCKPSDMLVRAICPRTCTLRSTSYTRGRAP